MRTRRQKRRKVVLDLAGVLIILGSLGGLVTFLWAMKEGIIR